jgi:hypothetical protein
VSNRSSNFSVKNDLAQGKTKREVAELIGVSPNILARVILNGKEDV